MTNEDFLKREFGKIYDSIDAEDQRDYLLQQMNWLQEYWGEVYEQTPSYTTVRAYPDYGVEVEATGSCLLEAIENAQKEMNSTSEINEEDLGVPHKCGLGGKHYGVCPVC